MKVRSRYHEPDPSYLLFVFCCPTGNIRSFSPFICDIPWQDFLLRLFSDDPIKQLLLQGLFPIVPFSSFSPPFLEYRS